MHFLLVSTVLGPRAGGTEMQIARMSRWLIAHGHKVSLLGNSVRELVDLFPEGMAAYGADEQLNDFSTPHRCLGAWRALGIEPPQAIKAFDLRASWIATLLSGHIQPSPKVIFGNYYPYLVPTSRNLLRERNRRFFLLNLRRNFTDQSILCMTREHVTLFQRAYGADRKPVFWPLPVEDLSVTASARTPTWGKIVSVGRLDPMKEYNLYMVDVIAGLRRRGLAVTWTVYGDGSFRPAMEHRIAELQLGDAIRLAGPIRNSDIPVALKDAYIFVGMGTAIIEAALCRVPGVMALAYENTEGTYGPLYNFTFGNVGERMDVAPQTTITAEIERILRLSPEEYEGEILKNLEYARRYDMDATMQMFLDIVEHASPPRRSMALSMLYYPHALVNGLVEQTRRLLSKVAVS